MREIFLKTIVFFILLVLLFNSCTVKRLVSKLDPVSEEFYSKVRYIMTKEESKIFLELPPSTRAEFIEEFWERRNPTPGTEKNNFKKAYYTRIEEANRLFRGGGRPGWLQDRGRIYILFGPPNERQTNPMGGRNIDPYEDTRDQTTSRQVAAGEKPSEIWIYYNLFSSLLKPQVVRIVFVDTYGTGDYQLTSNLNELIPGMMGIETQFAPNLAFMHEISKEEAFRARLNLQKLIFDFSWELLKTKNKEMGSNLLIHIMLPYDKIVFAKENETLRAAIELDAVIKDSADKIIWQFEEEYNLNFREDFLIQNREGFWEMEIPVTKWLKKGNYSVYLSVKNLSGDQEIKKLLPLKI